MHIFTSDILPDEGLPTSGGGLRSLQVIQGLRAHGFEVTYSMPLFTYLASSNMARFSTDDVKNQWTGDNQSDILRRFKPDVALWNNANSVSVGRSVRTVLPMAADLHGPMNIESHFIDDVTLTLATFRTLNSLTQFDFFTTVSERQKYYWLAYLAAAGIAFEDLYTCIGIVPLSVEPQEITRKIPRTVKLVWAGGFYPWQSCFRYLRAVAEFLTEAGSGSLHIFGSPHAGISGYEEIKRELDGISGIPSVTYHGYVSRRMLLGHFSNATCAIDLYEPNAERALAVTTRTMDYLACGVPVIHGDYATLSSAISGADAGWIVDTGDTDALKDLLTRISSMSRRELLQKSSNALKLMREDFNLKSTLVDLARFCAKPRKRISRFKAAWKIDEAGALPGPIPIHLSKGHLRSKIRIIRKEGTGFVDDVRLARDGEGIWVRGWALEADARRPARKVIALIGNSVVASVEPNMRREDICKTFGPGVLMSGFEFVIPCRGLKMQSGDELRILSLQSDCEAAEVEVQPGHRAVLSRLPRRVLVFSPDILPLPGLPTVGSGLRAWGLGQGLSRNGFDVRYSMPKPVLEKYAHLVDAETIERAWWGDIDDVIARENPGAVVICGWSLMGAFDNHPGVPVCLDQHGPHILERQFDGYGQLSDNSSEKCRALKKADFFTCAGEKQAEYFGNWLAKAGWTDEERATNFSPVPFSLSPEMPLRKPCKELTFVYGGVFLPWQDPRKGLEVLAEILEKKKNGRLLFFGGRHPTLDLNTGVFKELEERLKRSKRSEIRGFVPHDELIEAYSSAHVAFDLMVRNPERELAFTSRTVEYLWCGLPVVYNDYSELSEYIDKYQAGWTVDPSDKAAIGEVLESIYRNPGEVSRRGANAQRLVREMLNWDDTIKPLADFLRNPRFRNCQEGEKPNWIGIGSPTVAFTLSYRMNQLKYFYNKGGVPGVWKEFKRYASKRLRHFSRSVRGRLGAGRK